MEHGDADAWQGDFWRALADYQRIMAERSRLLEQLHRTLEWAQGVAAAAQPRCDYGRAAKHAPAEAYERPSSGSPGYAGTTENCHPA